MSEHGRGAIASAAQRKRARQLIAEGWSIRQTAAEVFGEARYRGRVERIIGAPTIRRPSDPTASDTDVSELTPTELIRILLERRLVWLAEREIPPSGNELVQLLKAQLMLHHREAYERSHAATREKIVAPAEPPTSDSPVT
jgi:ParB-like chromosome segregation protein Spo0J